MQPFARSHRGIVEALIVGALALASCQCGGGTSDAVIERPDPSPEPVDGTGLTFPLDPPSLYPLEAFPAFDRLSFDRPVFLTAAPGQPDRIYVVEQGGRIVSFERRDDVAEVETFLDIRERVRTQHNEEGLLGLAFHPDFERNGLFYVYYGASDPRRVVVSRFTAPGEHRQADPDSESEVLSIEQPYGNHNGGMIAFGPDGMLYLGPGDGGSAGDPLDAGQDLSTLLGKMLRIAVDPDRDGYRIPSDNPFVGQSGARGEIWAYGLRNPWRFSFDRQTGELWAGDVGQDALEEIDLVERGGNYGWRVREGTRAYTASDHTPAGAELREPVIEYDHDLGTSITGGYVYRGTALAGMRGAYFYGDYTTGRVWALVRSASGEVSSQEVARVPDLSSFGEDAAGELYALDHGRGRIFAFAAARPDEGAPGFPQRLSETGVFTDLAKLTPAEILQPYDVRVPLWSDGAAKRRWLALPKGERIEFATDGAWSFPVGTVLVKHFELPRDDAPALRLETRVMVHERGGWAGYTYRWNEAQTDAVLVRGREHADITLQRDGQSITQRWEFPSSTDCLRCHTSAYGQILGFRTRQLGPEQIERFRELGLFSGDIPSPSSLPVHPEWDDENASVESRARAYLETNCAVCHMPGGPAPSTMDLRSTTALDDAALVGVSVEETVAGLPSQRIAPGAHEQSALWVRMHSRDANGMPPLATTVVDERGSSVVAAWIDSLTP